MSTNKTVVLQDVLFSYLYCAQPYVGKSAEGKETRTYCVHAVFPATHPAFATVREAMREVAKAAWGEALAMFPFGPADANGQASMIQLPTWEGKLRGFQQENKIPLRDGNRRTKQEEPYTGNFFVAANSTRQPRVVVTRGGVNVEIKPDDPQYPYSGARGNVIIDIWAQGANGKPSKFGQRINAQLTGVQFLAHGQKFGGGGRIATMDEFGLCPADADAPPPGVQAAAGAPSLI
jgi:hypothetical protein